MLSFSTKLLIFDKLCHYISRVRKRLNYQLSRLAQYPDFYRRFSDFRDFLHPGTVFGVEHEFTETPARKYFFVAWCTCKVFNRLARALRDQYYFQTSFHSIELIKSYKTLFQMSLQLKRKPRYDYEHLKFRRFCEFQFFVHCMPILPRCMHIFAPSARRNRNNKQVRVLSIQDPGISTQASYKLQLAWLKFQGPRSTAHAPTAAAPRTRCTNAQSCTQVHLEGKVQPQQARAPSIQDPEISTQASYTLQLACVKTSGSQTDSTRTHCSCTPHQVHQGANMCMHLGKG